MRGFSFSLLSILLVINLFVCVYYGFVFFNNFHTIDLAYNMCLISNDVNEFNYQQKEGCPRITMDYRDWSDRLSTHEVKSYFNGYIDATSRMATAFIRFGLAGFGLGLITTVMTLQFIAQQEKIDLYENSKK